VRASWLANSVQLTGLGNKEFYISTGREHRRIYTVAETNVSGKQSLTLHDKPFLMQHGHKNMSHNHTNLLENRIFTLLEGSSKCDCL